MIHKGSKHEGRQDLLHIKDEIQDCLDHLEFSFWDWWYRWEYQSQGLLPEILKEIIVEKIQSRDEIFAIVSIDPVFAEKQLKKQLQKKQREMEAEAAYKISLLDILEARDAGKVPSCYFSTEKNKKVFFEVLKKHYPECETEVQLQPIFKANKGGLNLKQLKEEIKEKMGDINEIKLKYPNHDFRLRTDVLNIWKKEIIDTQ